jgi:NAD(P)-dependent dehydrogenase (short-subunit alcohol dehydrogenase family)
MQLGMEDKRALVTGASRGLGRAIALTLAREGAKVAVISRTASELSVLLEEMGGESKGHQSVAADLMAEGEPVRALDEAVSKSGPLDIVVHNLGGTLSIKDLFCPVADWRRVWRLNFEIALEINRVVIPGMQSRKWGRVVHISSIAAVRGRSSIPYAVVKAAVNAYTRDLGRAVAADGVVVTAVMPGPILAKNGHWDVQSRENPEYVKTYVKERIAVQRFGTPQEIGEFVVFLCSEHASFFAGAVIPIDGGTW